MSLRLSPFRAETMASTGRGIASTSSSWWLVSTYLQQISLQQAKQTVKLKQSLSTDPAVGPIRLLLNPYSLQPANPLSSILDKEVSCKLADYAQADDGDVMMMMTMTLLILTVMLMMVTKMSALLAVNAVTG